MIVQYSGQQLGDKGKDMRGGIGASRKQVEGE
jgi:hypothetical protein